MIQNNDGKNSEAQFIIQRIYVKDLSFEIPNSPQVFQQEWKPEIALELNTGATGLGDDIFDVVLHVTVTVKNAEKIAFLGEVKQAGIFTIKGAPAEQLHHILGSFCPTILFPYAREVISDMVSRGSFPQLVLAPVNFDILYAKQLDAKTAEEIS